eukprot:2745934-Rhodomonas_salina.3
MKAVIGARFSPATVLARLSTGRVIESVPSTPTTVLSPPCSISDRRAAGTLEPGPASPPPPVTCTCMSTRPGVTTRPVASRTRTSSAFAKALAVLESGFRIRRILPPPIRRSRLPRGEGS